MPRCIVATRNNSGTYSASLVEDFHLDNPGLQLGEQRGLLAQSLQTTEDPIDELLLTDQIDAWHNYDWDVRCTPNELRRICNELWDNRDWNVAAAIKDAYRFLGEFAELKHQRDQAQQANEDLERQIRNAQEDIAIQEVTMRMRGIDPDEDE